MQLPTHDPLVTSQGSVMVTGVGGFIGSHLAEALLSSGVAVVGIDIRASGEAVVARNLRECFKHRHFRYCRADLTRTDVRSLLAGCHGVFHLAGLAGVRPSWGERFEDYLTANVLSTHRLLQWCDEVGVPHLVLASSSSVYGGAGSEPLTEEDATTPSSPYGVSKLAAEKLAVAVALHPATAVRVTALRYFSVFGPRQRPDMLISRVLNAAMSGQAIRIFGNGLQKRDFTGVSDVVVATLAAARVTGTADVINVGGGQPRTVRDVLAIASRLTGRQLEVEYMPPAAGDVESTWADLTKSRRLLAYRATISLEDGMAAQWSWMTGGRAPAGIAAGELARAAIEYEDPLVAGCVADSPISAVAS